MLWRQQKEQKFDEVTKKKKICLEPESLNTFSYWTTDDYACASILYKNYCKGAKNMLSEFVGNEEEYGKDFE